MATYLVPLLGVVIVYFILLPLYSIFLQPAKIPGPFIARFTRFWELYQVRQGHFEKTNADLHTKYGPVVRIALNRYSLSNPEVIKQIYGHGSKFRKADFYHAFGAPNAAFADTFSERDIDKHSQKRRKVASLYSMSTLVNYEPFVDKCTTEFCSKLDEFAAQGISVDIPQWTQFYAFDVIGEITVAESFGFMKSGKDHNGILAAIHESSVYGSRVGLFPELHPILGKVVSIFSLPIPFDKVAAFITQKRQSRSKNDPCSAGDDFLSKLNRMKDSGKIDNLDINNTMGANIAAGSDTTSISLSAAIYHLTKNPYAVEKLRKEIREFEEQGKLSEQITFQETQRMPYLQAIIKESLRIHPATGQLLARVVPAGGAQLSGHFFPAGAEVGVNPWVLHFDRSVFGEDAQHFRPERWLEDEDKVRTMDANFLSFGTGARTCLGKNLSLLEMSKVIPQIYRRYEFALENPAQEWETDNVWFVKQKFRCFVKLLV